MSSPIVSLLGEFLLEGTTKVNTADKMADVDAVGIYFSAHWCGPCRGFTPQLAKAYTQMKAAGKKFEVSIMEKREIERCLMFIGGCTLVAKKKTENKMLDRVAPTRLFMRVPDPGSGSGFAACFPIQRYSSKNCVLTHILMKFFLIFPTVLMKLFYCFPWHWKRESLLLT